MGYGTVRVMEYAAELGSSMWEHSLQLSGQPGPEMGILCAQVNVSSEHDDAHVREGNNASDSGLLYSLKE